MAPNPMQLVETAQSSRHFLEGVIVLHCVANVLNFIAFVAPGWAEPTSDNTDFKSLGLWRYCGEDPHGPEGTTVCLDLVGQDIPGWLESVQGVMPIAFIALGASFAVLILYTCINKCIKNSIILYVFLASNLAAMIFLMIGICEFGAHVETSTVLKSGPMKIGWCFVLACLAAGFALLAQFVAVIELMYKSAKEEALLGQSIEMQSSGATSDTNA